MDQTIWLWIWIVVAAALAIGEMLSVTFFLLPFAIGAVAAVLANLLQANLLWQWIIFLTVSVIALAAFRPLAHRLTRNSVAKTGVDRLIGQIATVVNPAIAEGLIRVNVGGDLWNAVLDETDANSTGPLQTGQEVRVLRIDSTRLVVQRLP